MTNNPDTDTATLSAAATDTKNTTSPMNAAAASHAATDTTDTTPPGSDIAADTETAAEDFTQGTKPQESERIDAVCRWLDEAGITYTCYFHEASPTIEEAKRHWRQDGSKHCKNLFFRNHKGNRHYLVCFDCDRSLAIHDLEHRLHQGKLTFASPERMQRYLGLKPGSVSPFGLINDAEHHVHLFLDRNLRRCETLSFHPNDCRATVVISRTEFERYLARVGNSCEYIDLYE